MHWPGPSPTCGSARPAASMRTMPPPGSRGPMCSRWAAPGRRHAGSSPRASGTRSRHCAGRQPAFTNRLRPHAEASIDRNAMDTTQLVAEVEALYQTYIDAFNEGDTDTYCNCFDEKSVMLKRDVFSVLL